MSCYKPIPAVDLGIDPETKKHRVKFLPQRYDDNLSFYRSRYGSSLMLMPCGHCVACCQDYARTWQCRIMCEAEYYGQKTSFLTLTYAGNPPSTPDRGALRDFIKAVRNHFGSGIKFFGCGELGENTHRAHYHLILFGVDFSEDREIISKRGLNFLYRSKTADKLWNKGFVSIGSLDIASAGYVSKYCDKKKLNSLDSGEFVIMSRGLGRRYFEDHKDEIFNSDYLYFNGNKFKIPRYFLTLADNTEQWIFADDYKNRKRNVAINFRFDRLKSFSIEELAMIDAGQISLQKKVFKEGVRDVD